MIQARPILLRYLSVAAILLMLWGITTSNAEATNGYFSHGQGAKYKGVAGAGVALPLSGFAVAQNPGAIAFLPDGYDVSVALFNPNRQYAVSGEPSGAPGTFGLQPARVESGSKAFVIPAVSMNRKFNDIAVIAVAVYGNGGMNTDYDTNTFHGSTPTGVDLGQVFLAPAFALKATDRHAFGINPILAYQWFEARGLGAFAPFSSDPEHLTDQGHDSSFGFGGRIGYLGRVTGNLAFGASYQTKILMGEFDDYAGLFAEQGGFDIPANWTIGFAVSSERVDLLFDVQQIQYNDASSVGNPMFPNMMKTTLGEDNAAGFGWDDMTVFKGGIQVRSGKGWTWRAGYSMGEQPIPESEMLFNILAPGVMEQHLTFGFSKDVKSAGEVSFVITHALSKSISGPNLLEAPGQQKIELEMDQWEAAVGYSF